MKRLLLLVLSALCLTGCHCLEREIRERQVVLVYFAGNNSLAPEGEDDYELLKNAWLPRAKEKEKIVLVYHHFLDQTPVLLRLCQDRKGNIVEEIIMEYPYSTNSASAETLSTVLADAKEAWPAAHNGLILWSHASGFLPPGYYINPKEQAKVRTEESAGLPETDPYAHMVKSGDVKSFGEDHGDEMELGDLRKALSGTHFDYIVFDCCLMANVEVAYELRNCGDYLVFSPTEILSDGFPYESMIQPLFSLQPEEAMKNVCRSYMALYRAQTGVYCSATISLVRTADLPALAAACKPVFQNHQEQILTIDRSGIQPYFRYNKHWFYDLDDFVGRVATDSEYQAFHNALERTVIFKDATDAFLSIDITHYSGLSSYIPRPEYTVLNNYYKTLEWNRATGLVN